VFAFQNIAHLWRYVQQFSKNPNAFRKNFLHLATRVLLLTVYGQYRAREARRSASQIGLGHFSE
jgi:hypothetical protein